MLGATALYATGGFGLTMACNVPLNNALDAFDLSTAGPGDLQVQRGQFEIPWNRYHMVRTIASMGSLACTILAIIKK
jgi:uncharacterized membrane protein